MIMENKSEKVHTVYEIAGWYGMCAILLGFSLASFGVINPTGLTYQLMNLTGAAGILAISYKKKVWQSVGLNAVWILVGLFALIRVLFFV